jgi:hypothetical protein
VAFQAAAGPVDALGDAEEAAADAVTPGATSDASDDGVDEPQPVSTTATATTAADRRSCNRSSSRASSTPPRRRGVKVRERTESHPKGVVTHDAGQIRGPEVPIRGAGIMTTHGRTASVVIAVVILSACSGAVPAASGDAPSTPSAAASLTPSATPSPVVASPATSAAPTPAASISASPSGGLAVGSVVTALADDGLRVRSKPRISDDSFKHEPLLPLGTDLLVLDGPVSGSGYEWYDVVPLSSGDLPSGWVASADRDGTPWIAPGAFQCPPIPTDFGTLASLARGVGLHCFAGQPITATARLLSCNCDIDGSSYTPSWFSLGTGTGELLVEPSRTTVPPDVRDWFFLSLDPAGEHPDPLPLGKVVEVTGVFDHPAARDCTETEMDGDPLPSQGCRLMYAVTRLRVAGP